MNNVTFRNILMDNTFKGIYVKMDNNGHRVQDLLYQNITIRGPTVEAPVMIGPINQFAGGCPWSWPMLPGSECAAYSSSDVTVTIDGLRVTERGGFPLRRSADIIIMGNNHSNLSVNLRNIHVDGDTTRCDDPPMSAFKTCNNACYEANVTTDGTYPITCQTHAAGLVPNGRCVPHMGSSAQRCTSGHAVADRLCIETGKRCANPPPPAPPQAVVSV